MQTTYSVLNLLLSILALYDVNSRDILQLKCRIAIFINIRLPPLPLGKKTWFYP